MQGNVGIMRCAPSTGQSLNQWKGFCLSGSLYDVSESQTTGLRRLRIANYRAVTLNGGTIDERWIGKDLEGSGRGVIEILLRYFYLKGRRKITQSLSGEPVFRPEFESSTSQIYISGTFPPIQSTWYDIWGAGWEKWEMRTEFWQDNVTSNVPISKWKDNAEIYLKVWGISSLHHSVYTVCLFNFPQKTENRNL
jgi:hypothetical protein